MSKQLEFARGWPVLVASALGSGTGVAALMFYSLGALLGPLTSEFAWSRQDAASASQYLTFGMLPAALVVGWLADRYGARRVALISQVLLVLAVASLSLLTRELWTLQLGYFLVGVLGAGTLPITWSRAVTGWFVSARGVALAASLVGTGLVGMSLPSYVTWLTQHYGWRGAFFGLAALPLVLGMPAAWLFFHEPESDHAARATGGGTTWGYSPREALRQRRFWQMALAFFLAAVVIGAINVHAISLLTDRGIDRFAAARLAGLLGLTVVFGRFVSGYFLDLYPGTRVAFVMLAVPALACVLLGQSGASLLLCGGAIILVGLAAGAEHDIAAYFGARYFGRRHYGVIYGLIYSIYTLGSGLSPKWAGQVYDTSGSYDLAIYAGAVIFLIAALLAGTLGPYPNDKATQ